jgi:hypothetical protein
MEEKEKIVENLTQEAIKNKGLKETNLDVSILFYVESYSFLSCLKSF